MLSRSKSSTLGAPPVSPSACADEAAAIAALMAMRAGDRDGFRVPHISHASRDVLRLRKVQSEQAHSDDGPLPPDLLAGEAEEGAGGVSMGRALSFSLPLSEEPVDDFSFLTHTGRGAGGFLRFCALPTGMVASGLGRMLVARRRMAEI